MILPAQRRLLTPGGGAAWVFTGAGCVADAESQLPLASHSGVPALALGWYGGALVLIVLKAVGAGRTGPLRALGLPIVERFLGYAHVRFRLICAGALALALAGIPWVKCPCCGSLDKGFRRQPIKLSGIFPWVGRQARMQAEDIPKGIFLLGGHGPKGAEKPKLRCLSQRCHCLALVCPAGAWFCAAALAITPR